MIWTQLEIYHCLECTICRVGNASNHFHCKTCNVCFNKNTEEKHQCLFRKSVDQLCCPFCLDDVFSSQDSVNPLRCCGQAAHLKCITSSLSAHGYKCPSCRKSFVDMTSVWEEISLSIDAQPMPSEYAREVEIVCNDCEGYCRAFFHFLGMQCDICGSYNTSRTVPTAERRTSNTINNSMPNPDIDNDNL